MKNKISEQFGGSTILTEELVEERVANRLSERVYATKSECCRVIRRVNHYS